MAYIDPPPSAAQFSNETVQSLIELGRQTSGPAAVQQIDSSSVPFIIHNGKVTMLPELVFNEHSERPERLKGTVTVFDPESFGEYFRKFSDADTSTFADETKWTVTAVLDYHEAGNQPRWGQHRLILSMRHAPEWTVWSGSNNRQMTQQQFSEFLEQNSLDIADPSPAAIIDVARDLQGTTEVEFGSGQRMQDGQIRFKYTEQTKTTVGASQVAVPEQFTIAVPVFIGGNPGRLQALLRYRCKEGKLTFWYTLVRPDHYVRQAFDAARQQIAKNLGIAIINGVPG